MQPETKPDYGKIFSKSERFDEEIWCLRLRWQRSSHAFTTFWWHQWQLHQSSAVDRETERERKSVTGRLTELRDADDDHHKPPQCDNSNIHQSPSGCSRRNALSSMFDLDCRDCSPKKKILWLVANVTLRTKFPIPRPMSMCWLVSSVAGERKHWFFCDDQKWPNRYWDLVCLVCKTKRRLRGPSTPSFNRKNKNNKNYKEKLQAVAVVIIALYIIARLYCWPAGGERQPHHHHRPVQERSGRHCRPGCIISDRHYS
jgi:hypothetical protein